MLEAPATLLLVPEALLICAAASATIRLGGSTRVDGLVMRADDPPIASARILGDTMGRLIYRGVAQVAFIGGSLCARRTQPDRGRCVRLAADRWVRTISTSPRSSRRSKQRAVCMQQIRRASRNRWGAVRRSGTARREVTREVANNAGATGRIADRLALEISASLRRCRRRVRDRVWRTGCGSHTYSASTSAAVRIPAVCLSNIRSRVVVARIGVVN